MLLLMMMMIIIRMIMIISLDEPHDLFEVHFYNEDNTRHVSDVR